MTAATISVENHGGNGLRGSTHTIAAVKDNLILSPVQDGRQFHASGAMDAKIAGHRLAVPEHPTVGHGKLAADQIAKLAQGFFDLISQSFAKIVVNQDMGSVGAEELRRASGSSEPGRPIHRPAGRGLPVTGGKTIPEPQSPRCRYRSFRSQRSVGNGHSSGGGRWQRTTPMRQSEYAENRPLEPQFGPPDDFLSKCAGCSADTRRRTFEPNLRPA